jgi:hypothetical protein
VYARRLAVYDSVATLTIDTDRRRPEDVAADVLARLTPGEDAPSPAKAEGEPA